MAFLSKADKARIAEAIRASEAKTTGELVTVIAQAADDYTYIPLLWAALVALVFPGVVLLLHIELPYAHVYEAQVLAFIVAAIVFHWMPIKMRLIPAYVKQERARRLAREQFFRQNLHDTRDRTGVLLFVSVAERYVEIVADRGINEKVEKQAWEGIIADFVQHVKEKRIADGFVGAVAACGAMLAEHFPAAPEDKNELPDHLIEI